MIKMSGSWLNVSTPLYTSTLYIINYDHIFFTVITLIVVERMPWRGEVPRKTLNLVLRYVS